VRDGLGAERPLPIKIGLQAAGVPPGRLERAARRQAAVICVAMHSLMLGSRIGGPMTVGWRYTLLRFDPGLEDYVPDSLLNVFDGTDRARVSWQCAPLGFGARGDDMTSKLLALITVGLVFACASGAHAAETAYTIDFTTEYGNAPTSGSFDWDGTTISNLDVTWDGLSFDLTGSANFPEIVNGGSCGGATGSTLGWDLLSGSCNGGVRNWNVDPSSMPIGFGFQDDSCIVSCDAIGGSNSTVESAPLLASGGVFTIVPVTAVPEPSTLLLTVFGLAGLALARRRQAVRV
jgi:hypothetical protein